MATVELDTAGEYYVDDEFQEFLTDNKIELKVMQEHGPGGGWPVIKYTGTVNALKEMIDAFWGDSDLWKFIKE